jgi:hypothetical protein
VLAVHVTVRRKVKAPIHQAWPKLADFGALATWMHDVESCKGEKLRLGARRVVTLKEPAFGKTELVETVNALRPQGFTYDIEGGVGPWDPFATSWDLEPKGDGCVVVVRGDFTVNGKLRFAKPLSWLGWRRQLGKLAKDFATYAAS